jgi:hypothetical protein
LINLSKDGISANEYRNATPDTLKMLPRADGTTSSDDASIIISDRRSTSSIEEATGDDPGLFISN